MRNFKFWLSGVFTLIFILLSVSLIAQESNVKLFFFYMKGCSHCKGEKNFLDGIKREYKDSLEIIELEVTGSRKNSEIMADVAAELKVTVPALPFTVIGKSYFIGWDKSGSTGLSIRNELQKCLKKITCEDIVSKHLQSVQKGTVQTDSIPESFKIPIIGEIKTSNISLPVLTILLAALDGFNPCAMWVLMFLISLLLGMENKRKRWILGISFLLASAFVYFVFMAAWLNLFLFIGYVTWVRILIGLVALYAAFHYIRQYIVNPEGACEVSEGKGRQRIFERLKAVIQKKYFFLSLIGIILLSFAVNLVELICSAGLPAVYTQTLAASNLPQGTYYLYISLYIFIFLLDDLAVFVVAMVTLQATGLSTRYTRISQLIGGLVMFLIGMLMIFKPEWLMFG